MIKEGKLLRLELGRRRDQLIYEIKKINEFLKLAEELEIKDEDFDEEHL